MRFRSLIFATTLTGSAALSAAVIGTNTPALPLTAARLATIPADQRPAWQAYLALSKKLHEADNAALAAELKAAGLAAPLVPSKGRGVPLNHNNTWFASPEAARIADIVVSFQILSGGWNKNTDQTLAPRRPGERHGYESGYAGTIDNDATITQLQFLAKTLTAAGPSTPRTSAWHASFTRGVDYLLTAQYPNGGWPQIFPLEGGYHDAVTFNDGAVINVLTLLRGIATGRDPFNFVPAALRARAATSFQRGLACIFASQIVVHGRRTIWCQQVDMLTLAPCGARNYEMPSQATGESAGILMFLMALPDPSPAAVTAVRAAAAWFQKTPLRDVVFKPAADGTGRKLLPSPGAGPLWPRYSEIGTDRPLFGDRDLSIHDDVNEISEERRNGYSWYGDAPKRALEHYASWAKAHPPK
jgi:PelA/Pel-15E family pectate lyase